MDLVLSSGFLAFARQAGFLQAVEDHSVDVQGIVGTSSGALAGSLFAAGYSAQRIAEELSARRPLALCGPHLRPWRGLFTMAPVIQHLSQLLPATFADLPLPFGVGVMTPDGGHRLVTSGPLPQAVAASMAIPRLFQPVPLDGQPCADGAFVDRTALHPWLAHRGEVPTLIHLVERSSSTTAEPDWQGRPLVRTPRSHAKLWSLGDFTGQMAEARELAREVIGGL